MTPVPRHRLLLPLLLLAGPLAGQLAPPATGGLVAQDQELRRLGHNQRLLLIAAHPDDEDTELLTVLVRGFGAEAAYLSLNRGEGGQNLIGQELGEELGLLRTEELLAARRLDGARQFFTRAYDFGYSRNLEDTWAHWPRDSVLKDVVRIVRRFRPQVVVSVFSGTPRDGHGQHQAAGWAAQEAFLVAGDPARFPELEREEGLAPWAPLKLYRSTRFDSAATTLTLDGGALDPAVGQSFHQIAMRGRSLHRSQDMGQLQAAGPSTVRLALLTDRTGGGSGLFGGVDTTLAAVPFVAALRAEPRRKVAAALALYVAQVDSARLHLAPREGDALRALLDRAAATLEAARRAALDGAPGGRGREVQADVRLDGDPFEGEVGRLARARRIAAGVVVDATTTQLRVAPGESLAVTATLWNTGPAPAPAGFCLGGTRSSWNLFPDSAPRLPLNLSSRRGSCAVVDAAGRLSAEPRDAGMLAPGRLLTARLEGTLPAAEDYTTPYFLRAPRQGDLYTWDPDQRLAWGDPFGEPRWWITPFAPGQAGEREPREIAWRANDQATGEVRRPITVVPVVDVRLTPETEVWPIGAGHGREFVVTLTHGARDTTEGKVTLVVPAGFTQPAPQLFRLTRPGEVRRFTFRVTATAALTTGSYRVDALAIDRRGRVFDVGLRTVEHPHIHARTWSRHASAVVRAAPLALPRLRAVAYLRGAADRVPEALQQVGLPVTVITGADLAAATPAQWPVIVIGPRAFETDTALPAQNDRLLAYARAGGTVIVQYQQYGYFLGGYAPYPMTVGSRAPGTTASTATRDTVRPISTALLGGHDRVTDEAAPVRLLEPAALAFRAPNRLGPGDWEGWVQERGLYFARSWDRAWSPLLELHDPGEPPLQGGLLVARVGRGTYVYTGLSFFRQLPAAVPGAFRLFANLLALGESRATTGPAPRPRADSLPAVERE